MSKYYAVKSGKKPGIYLTWPECEAQVKGYPNAIFKSFKNLSDANQFLKSSPKLNPKQQEALELLMAGNNAFITGKAGTGKSYLINEFIKTMEQQDKNILVCAPTGIAAINIGGVTVHRCFQITLEPQINTKIKQIPLAVRQADIIIIDEISMCRIDIFEHIIKIIDKARKYKKIQLIVVGDFCQLPPVTTKNDRQILTTVYPNYDKGFAFESPKWKECNFTTINLTTVMRQDDNDFIEHLNMIREGNPKGISYFNQQANKTRFSNGITLSAYNGVVNKINHDELAKLNTPSFIYQAIVSGEVKPSDKPTADILELKQGARVMVLINDPDLVNYQNGSLGTVVALNKLWVMVKMDHNGNIITFDYHEWKIENYIVETVTIDGVKHHQVKKNKIGSFIQIPLKLAYAITIHKSQGQTYKQVNLIPHSFDCGQLYVALSRIKTISGLHLVEKMQPKDLICHQAVKNFYHPRPIYDQHLVFEQLGKAIYHLDPKIQSQLPIELKQLINKTKKLLNNEQ